MKITELEQKMLIGILEDDYQPCNGSEPETFADCGSTYIWSAMDNSDIEPKSRSGVMSSLVKKGLAKSENLNKMNACCWVTEKGFDVYKAIKKTDKTQGA